MGMRVRPTSIDSVTGTSRMTSRLTSRAASDEPASCRSPNSARAAASEVLAFMDGFPSDLVGQQGVENLRLETAHALLDLHRLLAVRDAESATEDRHVLGENGGASVEIAR